MTHKPTAAVSIGNLGKVFTDIRNHRAKGFLTEVHTSIAEVAGRLRHVAMEHSDVSRISVRVLVGRNVDPALASKIQIPWKHGNLACEAVITVNQGVIGSLLYFGSNAVTRTTSSKTIAAEWALLGSLLIEKRSKKELPQDFALEILKKPSQSDIDQLIKIYKKAFTSYLTEFTPEVIRAMLAANIVAVVRDAEGRIAAVSQAEIARFTAAGEEWRLVELSETASHPDFRGQGLAYACKEKVIEQFRGSA